MDEPKANEIRQWLFKARNDLRSAERLFSVDPPLLDTAAYHCQQAAEKALKAFLVLHEIQISKIHLLSALVEQCMDVDPSFDQLRDAAETLTPFATLFRYPGDVLEPEYLDVMEGVTLAEKLVKFVEIRLPDEVKRG